jgi:hypothetical protein
LLEEISYSVEEPVHFAQIYGANLPKTLKQTSKNADRALQAKTYYGFGFVANPGTWPLATGLPALNIH